MLPLHGSFHAQFGYSWSPAVVDSFDGKALRLRPEGGGLSNVVVALDLRDAWETAPWQDCQFFDLCRECKGLGEIRHGKHDPCVACHGEGRVGMRLCPDCKGHGYERTGKGVRLGCPDCGGWGVQMYHPFKHARRKPVRKKKSAPDS